jgi:nucleoside-diphosphate-sugar epimerase
LVVVAAATLQLQRLAEVLGVPVVDARRDDPATPKRLADALVQALAVPAAERRWIWPDAQVEASFRDLADRLAAATGSERRAASGTSSASPATAANAAAMRVGISSMVARQAASTWLTKNRNPGVKSLDDETCMFRLAVGHHRCAEMGNAPS